MVRNCFAFAVALFFYSCSSSNSDGEKKYFPVVPYLQSEVATVEKSVFAIKKITTIDSTHGDTVYIRREDFRKEAQPFLTLPDISTGKLKKQYVESENFDEMLERAVIQYMPRKQGSGEITRQEVAIKPLATGDTVTNIYVDRSFTRNDTIVQEHLQWLPGKSFQVYRVNTYAGATFSTQYKVEWQ